jgi:glutamate synthase (NADPH/NADH) large chain
LIEEMTGFSNKKISKIERSSLYSFENEHDACGVGLVVSLNGDKSHEIVENGLQVLENMVHRGAESADNATGDGAGITVHIPHEFILLQGIAVPSKGKYGTGLVFLPNEKQKADDCMKLINDYTVKENLTLLAVRDVPVNSDCLGEISRSNEPAI